MVGKEPRHPHDRVIGDRCQVHGRRNYDRDGSSPQHAIHSSGTTGHVVTTLLLSHPSCISLDEHRRLLRRAPFTSDKDEQSPGKLWVD